MIHIIRPQPGPIPWLPAKPQQLANAGGGSHSMISLGVFVSSQSPNPAIFPCVIPHNPCSRYHHQAEPSRNHSMSDTEWVFNIYCIKYQFKYNSHLFL